jgi:hypothetical protein
MMKINTEKDNKVIEMREKLGCTWALIGAAYGISRQGAQDYYNRAKKRQAAKQGFFSRLADRILQRLTKRLIIDPDGRED